MNIYANARFAGQSIATMKMRGPVAATAWFAGQSAAKIDLRGKVKASAQFAGQSTATMRMRGPVRAFAIFVGQSSGQIRLSGPVKASAQFAGQSSALMNPPGRVFAIAQFAGQSALASESLLWPALTAVTEGVRRLVASLPAKRSEFKIILDNILDNLLAGLAPNVGEEASKLRQQIGSVRADYYAMLQKGTLGTQLLACFTAANDTGVSLASMARVRHALFEETPKGTLSSQLVDSAIMFCLGVESRIIAGMQFESRNDVETMLATMKVAFDAAREIAADAEDSDCYQSLTYLAGALTNHLVTVARPLPRVVKFSLPQSFPALTLSQYLYHEASRSDELISENKIIHPCFCGKELRGLSA